MKPTPHPRPDSCCPRTGHSCSAFRPAAISFPCRAASLQTEPPAAGMGELPLLLLIYASAGISHERENPRGGGRGMWGPQPGPGARESCPQAPCPLLFLWPQTTSQRLHGQVRALLEGGAPKVPCGRWAEFPRQMGGAEPAGRVGRHHRQCAQVGPMGTLTGRVVPELRCRWERPAASKVAGGRRPAPGCTETASSLPWGCGRRRAGSSTCSVPGAGLWGDRPGRGAQGSRHCRWRR